MRCLRGLLVVVCAVAVGCSLRPHRTGANRFVKPGKPLVEIGEPLKTAKADKRPPVADLRPASTTMMVPTVESSDPRLSAALLRLAIAPTADTHRTVAAVYRELEILDMAYDHLLLATHLDRTDARAYEGLARIWRDWGFPQLGLTDASRAVYYAPSSAPAHNTLGTLLAALGDRIAARREYERAAKLDPAAGYPLNNLCSLSFLEGDVSRALGECRAAIALDPTLAAARVTLASLERRDASGRLR